MYIPFDQMPPSSRIWIYQANRKLTETEIQHIHTQLQQFTESWVAHATPLEASYNILYDRFILLAVNSDKHPASGCSIDASVRCIQAIEQQFAIDLLDKMNVTYRTGDFIAHKTLIDFRKMAKEKAVNPETIVFNNLVNTIEEWQDFWEVPAKDSWHARFF